MVTTHGWCSLLRVLLVMAFLAIGLLKVTERPRGRWPTRPSRTPTWQLRWRCWSIFELELLCAQVVIVCTWLLCGMVQRDRIFSHARSAGSTGSSARSERRVARLGRALALRSSAAPTTPGTPLLLAIMLLAGAVFGLLMVVMRALLKQATTLRTDMEAVI